MVEVLETKSITGKEVTAVIEEEGPTWMTKLVSYLKEEYVIKETHEGSCSMHAGPRSVVAKAIRLGYFWPTMHRDAQDMIRKCNDCQVHCPVTRHPQQHLTPITAPWPFYKWGIDIAGPFPEGPGKVKFLIVAMDYFTKWIEAKAVATITGGQVKKFAWDNIVCRFGIPGEIISDNGKQFADNPFKDWCDKLNITQHFASVKHPQSNGLVERANRSLGEGIKARLGEGNKNWVEELPHVLWAHRTMVKSSHGDTPFSLTYGTEAVIPAEIGMPTYRTTAIDVVNNDKELRLNLDLLEERRELAAINEARSKSKMTKYYNSRVRGVAFQPGNLVYRSNDASHAAAGGKLGPKWEGPYEVTYALGNRGYKLRSMDGTTWLGNSLLLNPVVTLAFGLPRMLDRRMGYSLDHLSYGASVTRLFLGGEGMGVGSGEYLRKNSSSAFSSKFSKWSLRFRGGSSQASNWLERLLAGSITTCGPHDTQYCIEDPKQAFVEYASSRTDEAGGEPKEEGSTTTKEVGAEYFDIFPTRSEPAYHKNLMCSPIPLIFLRNPIIMEGCPSNLKIPCNIRHVHVEKAYINPNFPLNIITQMMYNWIMRIKLDPSENSNRGVSNSQEGSREYLEKVHTKSVYLRNKEDKRRGVEYVMSKILGFHKECLELGPEYVIGIDDEGKVT
uniref:Reverse transcriptase domain-containing protein n=1 Tax=Tanacetum cinerariifolium TaxID=118510 RepID=A0A6L2LBT8_TANCI|nr:reverse transcriptase domain-containing protein [Tanacetum cinerariifolium]